MTASLLFFQASHQSRARDIEGGILGSSAQNRSAVSKTYDGSSCGNPDSFLSTFEQIAKDHKLNQQIQGVGRGKSTSSPANNPGEKFDEITETTNGDLEAGISQTTKQQEESLDNVERPIQPALNLAEIVNLIEKLRFNDLVGESGTLVKMDEIPGNVKDLADLKMLFDRLEQNDLALPTKMNADIDRLYQILVNNPADKAAPSMDLSLLGGLNDSRSTEPADLNQSMKKMVLGQENRSDGPTVQPAGSDSVEKPPGYFAIKWPNYSESASQSEFRETAESIKLAAEPRFIGIEAGENTKDSRSTEVVRMEIDGLKDGPVVFDKAGTPTQAKHPNRIPWPNSTGSQSDGELSQQNLPNPESSHVLKTANDAQSTRVLDPLQRYSGESVQLNVENSEASSVSKMIHDAQVAKENLMRMDDAMGDEHSGKVTKVDAASIDSGLPGSQNQLAEKAFDLTSLSRQADTGQDGLKTETLDQIVRKAVIYIRNGQHEAKIDLKPEFLGHVRMQVITENHQVTVKILTEFGFVKEMIENSIHQLKADLQQQGLNVDKLEVVVANDADEHKHSHEKSGQAKNRQQGGDQTNPGNQEGETREREHAGDPGPENSALATVDYFA